MSAQFAVGNYDLSQIERRVFNFPALSTVALVSGFFSTFISKLLSGGLTAL